jgi:hypothetical protein
MPHRNIAGLVVAVLATAPLVACSGQSPAAPSTRGAVRSNASPEGIRPPTGLEGSYVLYLTDTDGHVVSSLPVGGFGLPSEVVLWAQVKDSSGVLATDGSVIFQACKRGGGGFTAYKPSADCARGAASWTRLINLSLDGCGGWATEPGNACTNFGGRPIAQTIGFRYLYKSSKGSLIADGESTPQDMTWVAVQ